MLISRDKYLEALKIRMNNHMVKVITGIRRCGKSYLVFKIFHNYLIENGMPKDHIIKIELDQRFVINEAQRYDVKGRKYIGTPVKYYFEDIGLRNARLGFRQVEETHLMENIIYNELRMRGFQVDVGVVQKREMNDKDGITIMSVYDFLLKDSSLEM